MDARRFQFRLWTLMIVVTLLAIPCASVGRQPKLRERQDPQATTRVRFSRLASGDAGRLSLAVRE